MSDGAAQALDNAVLEGLAAQDMIAAEEEEERQRSLVEKTVRSRRPQEDPDAVEEGDEEDEDTADENFDGNVNRRRTARRL